ncbi:hypothetical protein [Brevundimonas sp. Root1279]|uniref:hypothetical protein n=1 Tax=Brevundimonas sp. Root1279 TaxID=1736443 RepID=UPI00071597B3|nr:hypothetical protein [Brevundimonas sp. Root1279]KQW86322.1 hypothetical protein ASC65_16565 [Brevundimonas sp. Root1279]
MRKTGLALVALMATAGCATEPASPMGSDLFAMMGGVSPEESDRKAAQLNGSPLGSEKNPVRANMPAGQREYLSRLRCADGRAPSASRIGSMGAGPYGSIVDAYAVICAGSSPAESTVYMDMYHPAHVETKAVPGFTIVN